MFGNQSPPMQVITATVPPGATPGSTIQVAGPNGMPYQVQVPPGAAPGTQFQCQVATGPPVAPQNMVMQQTTTTTTTTAAQPVAMAQPAAPVAMAQPVMAQPVGPYPGQQQPVMGQPMPGQVMPMESVAPPARAMARDVHNAIGFCCTDKSNVNPAHNLAQPSGLYISCTWTNGCLIIPIPCLACRKFTSPDDDTLVLANSCCCICCPGKKGDAYRRNCDADGLPGPPNSFSSHRDTYEFGACNGLCAGNDDDAMCYLRVA